MNENWVNPIGKPLVDMLVRDANRPAYRDIESNNPRVFDLVRENNRARDFSRNLIRELAQHGVCQRRTTKEKMALEVVVAPKYGASRSIASQRLSPLASTRHSCAL
jgi:hypothetical protein